MNSKENNLYNNYETIDFILEEMDFECHLDEIFSRSLSDEEFEKHITFYIDLIVNEIASTLNIEYIEAKNLYDDYLTKNIFDLVI
jgi:hypothetical protein